MKLIKLHHTSPTSDEGRKDIWVNADLIYSVKETKWGSQVAFSGGDLLPFDERPDEIAKLMRGRNGKE